MGRISGQKVWKEQKGALMAKIVSIEIGYSLTRICEMDYRAKSPRIYDYASVTTPQGIIEDGFIADDVQFALKLKDTLVGKKIRTKQVVFSVTSSKIATREVMLPMLKPNQLAALVKSNASEYFPIDLSEYEIAHQVLGVVKGEDKADRYRVMVMAAEKKLVEGYERLATQAGLRLVALDYSGNSIYQIMRNECKEDTEMIIKVDERATIATVINEQNLVLQRNVLHGVDGAVQTIMRVHQQEKMLYKAALEHLKGKTCIKIALSETTRILEQEDTWDESEKAAALRQELTDSLAMLVNNIARVADLYNSKNIDAPIKRIRLIGLGADISGLSKLFTNELGIRTTVMNNLESIDWDRAGGEGNPGRYIACIGAGISPAGFVSEESAKSDLQRVNYRNVAILGGLFCVVVAATLWVMALSTYNEALEAQRSLQRLEAEYGPAENVYNTYNNMVAFYKEVEIGYKSTLHPNDNLIAFLEELEEKLPADAELVEFTSNGEQATLTMKVVDKEQAAKVIQTLRGFDSVLDVSIGALDKEDIDEAVEDANEETTDGEAVEDTRVLFSIVCTYKPMVATEEAAGTAQ